ncbi:MAG: rane-bound lytic murein transglycosylase [Gammaproteobacteria bacterium]|nr:rane-bound lytic murein transglycosylase [Gammaproteobacteria bacterium]
MKRILLVGLLALVSGCAHQSVAPAQREHIEVPATEAPVAPPEAVAATGATPSLIMPREWQHHNGEDYDDLFDRMRAGFALDEVQEAAIDTQLAWFKNNPDYLERVFQRGQRYLYHIVTEVEARGMPLEFALLPVVESAYEPFAYSTSRASGMWQFIPGTGTRFGLKRDWWFDGRRDVIESTRAALDYLQALHDQFNGDWLLAIAAYNVGENSVQRELDFNRANGKPADFWHLRLPAETRAYVPKLLALKRLMAEPERYGLEFAAIPNEPYFAVIETGSQIDLKIAAQLAGTSYEEIAALNPGFNRWASDPDGPHRMLVPIDNADAFEAALKTLGPDDRVRFAVHEVTRKDTLAGIAKQYGASAMVIAKINDLKGTQLTPGQSLKIPEISGQLTDKVLLAASRVDRPETDVGGRRQRQIVYRVRGGETLSSIARRHGLPVSTLARLNNLGANDNLVKGQRLIIKASTRRLRDEGAGSGRRLTYTVKNGDTVFSISKQFQVSVTQLKNWNGLNQHHQIRAGQRLVMYVDANRQHG